MSKRKTRLQAALDYANDVTKSTNPCIRACGWEFRWAFIAGAKWQQNRSQKKRTAVGKDGGR